MTIREELARRHVETMKLLLNAPQKNINTIEEVIDELENIMLRLDDETPEYNEIIEHLETCHSNMYATIVTMNKKNT